MRKIKTLVCLGLMVLLLTGLGCGKFDLANTSPANKVLIGAAAFTGAVMLAGSTPVSSGTTTTTIPVPVDPVIIEDGVKGGSFASSDNNFLAVVPANTMPAGLRAQPTVQKVTIDPNKLLNASETLVSDTYELNLASITNYVTTNTIEVTLQFDASSIPVSKRTSQYIYAKVYDVSSEASLAIVGTISGSTLTLKLRGLAPDAIYSVVYNPYARVVLSGAISSSSVSIQSTQAPPWLTNRWLLWYDSTDNELRQVVADILGKSISSLTSEEIDAVVKERVADNSAAAGVVYQAAGFRQPNINPMVDLTFTGTTEPVFVIYLRTKGSAFKEGEADLEVNALARSYGTMYLDPKRLDDSASSAFGTVKASVAHEMLHAIQSGYDISYYDTTSGYMEGPAATYGVTIAQSAVEPQVRTANSTEIHLLSTYLGCENIKSNSFAYANQDFFAYVGRVYNLNSLNYLNHVYEQMKTDIAALIAGGTTSAEVAPPRSTLRRSLDTIFTSRFGHGLSDVYFDYVKKRAMEHSVASELRAGEPNPMTLNTSLFHSAALSIGPVDPEELATNDIVATFKNVQPFSSRAIQLYASKQVDDISAYLTIIPAYGSVGNNARAMLYRNGVGTELVSGPNYIADFGKTANDTLTVLVSNVDMDHYFNIGYRLSATPGPPGVNTFEAQVIINGTTYPFNPKTLLGAYGEYSSGSFKRTNLPSLYASMGSSIIEIDKGLIVILTDPNTISSSGGTYNFNAADKVFEKSNGSANLAYTTPDIVNADDASEVVFSSKGGDINFSNYTSTVGERLIGTFSAEVTGTQRTDIQGQVSRTLNGIISGYFDMELTNQQ